MTRHLRRLTKIICISLTVLTVLLFCLACCNSLLDPARYWPVAILGVGMVFIVLALLVWMILWWLLKSRWAFLPLATLLLGWPQIHRLVALHPFAHFQSLKQPGALRVMQWNVSLLDQQKFDRPGGNYRLAILDYIARQNPDILCMEEFLQSYNLDKYPENIQYISQHLHFPYYYFVRDYDWSFIKCQAGAVIFSKYPIVDTLKIRYNNMKVRGRGESLVSADINVNGTRLRVLATHLQSLHFAKSDFSVLHSLYHVEADAMEKSKGVLRKFRGAYGFRNLQAEMVRRELDASPWPVILCGDFNDIPNSFTYSRIRGDRKDAFLERGFGLGRSFYSISPTLRIDYILVDPSLEVLQYNRDVLPYSDHYPLVTDLQLPR